MPVGFALLDETIDASLYLDVDLSFVHKVSAWAENSLSTFLAFVCVTRIQLEQADVGSTLEHNKLFPL